ncbi:MAG TPA: hypothetical protein VFL69_15725 [Marmoricola sp.]|nr:hypothetical protein [Marmoricola sp.]
MALHLEKLAHLARDSHQAACRNARTASAVLAERARERREVEEFLARQRAARDLGPAGGPVMPPPRTG